MGSLEANAAIVIAATVRNGLKEAFMPKISL
jgi:hypothetical protein